MILIIDNNRVYRSAGYRKPKPGEPYVSRSAKVSLCDANTDLSIDVLVLLELIVVDPKERKLVWKNG